MTVFIFLYTFYIESAGDPWSFFMTMHKCSTKTCLKTIQEQHHYVLLFVVRTIVNTVAIRYRTQVLMLTESVACTSHHYLNSGG